MRIIIKFRSPCLIFPPWCACCLFTFFNSPASRNAPEKARERSSWDFLWSLMNQEERDKNEMCIFKVFSLHFRKQWTPAISWQTLFTTFIHNTSSTLSTVQVRTFWKKIFEKFIFEPVGMRLFWVFSFRSHSLAMLSLFPHWVEFTTPFDFWVCCQFNFVQTIGGSKLQIQIILQLVITDCKLLINLNSTVTECYLKRPKRIWNASIFTF